MNGHSHHASILGPGTAVAAFDVGGTDLKASLIDQDGMLREVLRRPTPHRGAQTPAAILDEVEAIMREFSDRYPDIPPHSVGMVIPGVVDGDGVGRFSENLGWRDVPFRRLTEERLHLPVAVGHDVRAAGDAERRLGAARGYDDVIVVVIGTGISGAIFIAGEPYLADGFAGEIGHAVVEPGGVPCACGGRGCLETIASAAAIAKEYARRSGETVAGAKDVVGRMQAGDRVAGEVWERAVHALAMQFAQTVSVLAPQAIVMGGGLAQAGSILFDPLRKDLDSLLTFQPRPDLLPATIGENAGLIGAALEARDLGGFETSERE